MWLERKGSQKIPPSFRSRTSVKALRNSRLGALLRSSKSTEPLRVAENLRSAESLQPSPIPRGLAATVLVLLTRLLVSADREKRVL